MCIDNIKQGLKNKTIHVTSFDDVNLLLFDIENNKQNRLYITFETRSLKRYFLDRVNNVIINTNSSYDRFCDDMTNYDNKSIFNNLNSCNDFDILNIIDKTNNILVD